MTTRVPRRVVRESATATGYLLDTHVWIWMLAGEERKMSARMWRLLATAAERGALHVSDVSCWEVALKAATGRYLHGLTLLTADRANLAFAKAERLTAVQAVR